MSFGTTLVSIFFIRSVSYKPPPHVAHVILLKLKNQGEKSKQEACFDFIKHARICVKRRTKTEENEIQLVRCFFYGHGPKKKEYEKIYKIENQWRTTTLHHYHPCFCTCHLFFAVSIICLMPLYRKHCAAHHLTVWMAVCDYTTLYYELVENSSVSAPFPMILYAVYKVHH